MTPNDPRHGSNAGYLAGCHETCCRTAHATYRRTLRGRRYLRRVDRLYIDATPTIRRIRALQTLGWRFVDIDALVFGKDVPANHTWSHNLVRQDRVHIDNARKIANLYEQLSMTIGPSPTSAKRARTKGYLPPLAWDDIDDLAERPRRRYVSDDRHKSDIDPTVVERFLARDITPGLWATQAEKREIVRRWDGSLAELERMTGWKPERYYKRKAA